MKISVSTNGPYLVSGGVPLARQVIVTDAAKESVEWRAGERLEARDTYALCRCGASATKPFCDGSHKRIGFDGTETADRRPYRQQAKSISGPVLVLTDVRKLCAFGRFCDAQGGVWRQVEHSDESGARALVVHESGLCPSGRLVARERTTDAAIEPAFEPSIGLVDDPLQGVAGPLWLRGGIPVIAGDGFAYEVRNRVTLCRCGASQNKPFCDGTHASIGFRDDR